VSQDAARDERSFSVGCVHLVAELAEALQVLFSKTQSDRALSKESDAMNPNNDSLISRGRQYRFGLKSRL
jgi:hypothetical protein